MLKHDLTFKTKLHEFQFTLLITTNRVFSVLIIKLVNNNDNNYITILLLIYYNII